MRIDSCGWGAFFRCETAISQLQYEGTEECADLNGGMLVMRCGFYLATLLVVGTASAFADDPKKDAAKDDKKPEAEKLISLGQVAGVLTNTGGSEANYTIRVSVPVVEPNQQAQVDYVRRQQQLVLRQVQIMTIRNPFQRQQQMVQLVRDAQQMPQNLFTVKQVQQDIHAVPADDMKVRFLAHPPAAFGRQGQHQEIHRQGVEGTQGTGQPARLHRCPGGREVESTRGGLHWLANPSRPATSPRKATSLWTRTRTTGWSSA